MCVPHGTPTHDNRTLYRPKKGAQKVSHLLSNNIMTHSSILFRCSRKKAAGGGFFGRKTMNKKTRRTLSTSWKTRLFLHSGTAHNRDPMVKMKMLLSRRQLWGIAKMATMHNTYVQETHTARRRDTERKKMKHANKSRRGKNKMKKNDAFL